MDFTKFSEFMREIEKKSGEKKKQIIRNFISQIKLLPKKNFLILFRFIFIDIDRSRKAFNVKEKKLSSFISQFLCLNKEMEKSIQNFQKPFSIKKILLFFNCEAISDINKYVGNFAETILFLFSKMTKLEPKGDVTDIDKNLDTFSNLNTNKEKLEILKELIYLCGTKNVDILIKLLLKDLNLNIDYDKILNFIHPSLVDKFNSDFDIQNLVDEIFLFKDSSEQINTRNRRNEIKKISFVEKKYFLKTSLKSNQEKSFFRNIKPMLAKRTNFDKIKEIITNYPNSYIFQEKYDGERLIIQIDKLRKEIRFFSRNCFDVTDIYKDSLEAQIYQCISESVNRVILDGEIIVIDNILEQPAPFGKNKEIALRDKMKKNVMNTKFSDRNFFNLKNQFFYKNSEKKEIKKIYDLSKNYLADNHKKERYKLIYIVFDLIHLETNCKENILNSSVDFESQNLFLNSFSSLKSCSVLNLYKNQMKNPFHNRYSLLKKILTYSHSVVLAKSNIIKSYKYLEKKLEEVLKKNGEGLIIKNIYSLYKPNKRNYNWIKMKGDYKEDYLKSLDLPIIGAYYSKLDKVTSGIKNEEFRIKEFLIGVRVSKKSNKIYPICKVDNGLSKNEILDLFPLINKNYFKVNNLKEKDKIKFFQIFNKNKPFPDLILKENKRSVILEIIFSEVNYDEEKDFPFKLRFPRFF